MERHQLDYIRHSAFHAAAAAFGEPPLLLDEHFRCHPEIVAVPNRWFYADRLTVLTDPRRLKRASECRPLTWVDVDDGTPERPAGGSWCNQAEVDRVVEEVDRLRRALPDSATIGVVTPFAAQRASV